MFWPVQGTPGAGWGEGRKRAVRAGVIRCGAVGWGEVQRNSNREGDWYSSVACLCPGAFR